MGRRDDGENEGDAGKEKSRGASLSSAARPTPGGLSNAVDPMRGHVRGLCGGNRVASQVGPVMLV